MSKRKEQRQRDKSKVTNCGETKKRVRRRDRKRPQVPPPDSAIWPEEYRGENWKGVYAFLFEGRCQLCAYSCPLTKWRQLQDKARGLPRLLLCTNHPDSPGELHEVLPIETCRNFQAKRWHRPRPQPPHRSTRAKLDDSNPDVRRIPLGNGLFALVDACDYEKISKYKWRASRRGFTTYATCVKNGRVVYMHRMIMKARKGTLVDHIDGNGLNNRRCNLRLCTHGQNRANVGPRGGVSRFVGVGRQGDKWVAKIVYRGKHHHLGLFDDEVEAAKARDRKAYDLHGEYAYLNFPEDFER
ncbi:MAG: HNH endonuclease [Sedimentisphaerales bacterium]|nr:HNH endonuclease [Sedimentisphaerales bacterium]